MLIKVESSKGVKEVKEKLEETAKSKGFGVMSTHEVTDILESKGHPISYRCVIVEICQPKAASEVLSRNPYISTAMPCRVAIFEENGKTVLSTIAPTQMIEMYNEPELKGVAEEIERLVKEIMEESAK
ncbi:DUF302 domain-containing protein [Hydrogenivirga sp. 128-5-R1-1]|uniref:DUF302 domain-containing protein n=1 Tax=Hydrogenivirga sp. 128-5-R1-1 TaxID=392423 RepID=UPI00015EF98F|nr:DUF302 domain-containing protein [Hydrogenivirga sp. 128-5-R1-1]EDP75258.1 hypothetical protein HG1285_00800 [Hydrogenivirga sp. 128-5-R1-1]